jgi:hypothetical protein
MSVRTAVVEAEGPCDAPWPPPPHDPRERELALVTDGWEVRLFAGSKFQYFVTRGFWHLQLWHPRERVSVLTPSRLTCGFYEAFPVAHWKAQAATYHALVTLIAGITSARFLPLAYLERLERSLVAEVVRGADVAARRESLS